MRLKIGKRRAEDTGNTFFHVGEQNLTRDLAAASCSTCWSFMETTLENVGSALLASWRRFPPMGSTSVQKQTRSDSPVSLHPGDQSESILEILALPDLVFQERA